LGGEKDCKALSLLQVFEDLADGKFQAGGPLRMKKSSFLPGFRKTGVPALEQ